MCNKTANWIHQWWLLEHVTPENKVFAFFNITHKYKKAMNGSTKNHQKKEMFESTRTAADMSPLFHFEVVEKGGQCKTQLLSALADRFWHANATPSTQWMSLQRETPQHMRILSQPEQRWSLPPKMTLIGSSTRKETQRESRDTSWKLL